MGDSWQKDFLKEEGDKILCTGRQVGKSVVCGEDAGEYSANHKGETILMIAPTERQAYALYEKTLQYLLDNYPKMIMIKADRPTKTRIKLKNKTTIWCLPTGLSGVGIRFLTVNRLYVDEASRVAEEVWTAVTPMLLTTGGDMILLSTPHGAQGEFWRTWINKDDAYTSSKKFRVNSEEVVTNRVICETWTEKTREKALIKIGQATARMSNKMFGQEFMGEFIEDLRRWFSDKIILESCIKNEENPIQGKDYYVGVDIARMGEDFGAYSIIRKEGDLLFQTDSIITKKKLTWETEDKIVELDRRWNFKKIYIDAGSGTLGVSVFDHLLRVPQVKRKVVAINNRARPLDYGQDNVPKTKILKEDL